MSVIILGGALVAAATLYPHGQPDTAATPPRAGDLATAPVGGWVWPVAPYRERRPQISDGWGSPRDWTRTEVRNGVKVYLNADGSPARSHEGADVGYWVALDEWPEFRAGTAQRSTGGHFVMPTSTQMRAMATGAVWSVQVTSRGIMVVLDHGKPWATLYQHLASCKWAPRAGGAGGPKVAKGETFGRVGNGHNPGDAPPNSYNHPHIQIQRGGVWIDPAPTLKLAAY